jgi:hypothetical protein
MKGLLTAVLFSALTLPAFAQAKVVPGFVTIAEGLTSPDRTRGIEVAYRMFSIPTFAKTCKESERPFTLTTPNGAVTLRVGEWFPLHRLVVVGVDQTGHVLRPLPIMLEVEVTNPPLLNLQPEMISDARVLPIRMGKFRFRARTICKGTSADVFIQAVVRPQ